MCLLLKMSSRPEPRPVTWGYLRHFCELHIALDDQLRWLRNRIFCSELIGFSSSLETREPQSLLLFRPWCDSTVWAFVKLHFHVSCGVMRLISLTLLIISLGLIFLHISPPIPKQAPSEASDLELCWVMLAMFWCRSRCRSTAVFVYDVTN